MKLIFSSLFRGIIIVYQKICSPLFIARCRYIPTCSQYGLEAIDKYGPWRGLFLTGKRIFNCHPLGGSGHDPVP